MTSCSQNPVVCILIPRVFSADFTKTSGVGAISVGFRILLSLLKKLLIFKYPKEANRIELIFYHLFTIHTLQHNQEQHFEQLFQIFYTRRVTHVKTHQHML